MKEGKWEQYFEDSSLRLSSSYSIDQLDGPYHVYNRNEILKIENYLWEFVNIHYREKENFRSRFFAYPP